MAQEYKIQVVKVEAEKIAGETVRKRRRLNKEKEADQDEIMEEPAPPKVVGQVVEQEEEKEQ